MSLSPNLGNLGGFTSSPLRPFRQGPLPVDETDYGERFDIDDSGAVVAADGDIGE